MAIDSDIRDQAYQFFTQEAPELLQLIEEELLTLKTERSIPKVHNMMRAAHSIKGGAASVGLDTIKTLAHSLEDIFKALHNEELEISTEIESLLLQAYDCLRLPLMEQINTGYFDSDQAMVMAEPVFAQIEAQLGDFLNGSDALPSSVELGVDIALSIFEVDVAQGLERLSTVIADPQSQEVAGELRAQAEVFAGIGELLNLPGFGAIAQTALAALEAHPAQALEITQLAIADFQAARSAVIEKGDRTQGGAPSTALAQLANVCHTDAPDLTIANDITQLEPVEQAASKSAETQDTTIFSLDDIFGDFVLTGEPTALEPSLPISVTPIELAVLELHSDTINLVNEKENIPELQELPKDAEAEEVTALPSLDDIFGGFALTSEPANSDAISSEETASPPAASIEELVQSAAIVPATVNLPAVTQKAAIVPASGKQSAALEKASTFTPTVNSPTRQNKREAANGSASEPARHLSVRVDIARLEQMNNLVGELSINRNGLALQNEQLGGIVQELLRRFAKFKEMGYQLRELSDQMLVAPERRSPWNPVATSREEAVAKDVPEMTIARGTFHQADFDSLEMDSYGELHSLLQATLEEIVQIEETVGDVVLVAGQSNKTLERQRKMLGNLRDDLMWARMLPLGEVLNRFPRILRDLSTGYEKPVDLKLTGTGVLVDKAALEKLYDPLLHLLRNAFDHGIEMPSVRLEQGKPERGQIEIRAYHQGSQTIIEVRDDGRGLNLDRIKSRALDMGLMSAEQAATTSESRLLELLFQPGFSTAKQVSELSGRGVGLDVVRSQLRSLKGNVTVTSVPGEGTTFTLRVPLTLTVAKLLVCFVGTSTFALPSDSIEEILIPKTGQVKQSGGQRFLHWAERIVPAYRLSELLHYACPLPETVSGGGLVAVPSPEDWAPPMLVLSQDDQFVALEIDRLVTEQELVIKPLGDAIAPPSYIYGCTIVGDGSLIPVIDAPALVSSFITPAKTALNASPVLASLPDSAMDEDSSPPSTTVMPPQTTKVPTVLVVDDSITLRQTLALTLQKAGYRVLQARDGREAIDQLQKNSTIQLVVCDVEMPNMNGFEFLSHRRQDPLISKIPTVMLTSRSSDKHRQLAMHLGAKAYFTKPYIEQEFLAALKPMIMQGTQSGVPAIANSR